MADAAKVEVTKVEVSVPAEVEPCIRQVNILVVVLYEIKHCHSVWDCTRAAMWLAAGLALVWFEIATMLALVISCAWPKCTSQDECSLGMACVQLPASPTTYSRAACEDCMFLIGDSAWPHKLPGEDGNATAVCEETLTHPGSLIIFDHMQMEPSFSSCLYALRTTATISRRQTRRK